MGGLHGGERRLRHVPKLLKWDQRFTALFNPANELGEFIPVALVLAGGLVKPLNPFSAFEGAPLVAGHAPTAFQHYCLRAARPNKQQYVFSAKSLLALKDLPAESDEFVCPVLS